MSDFNWTADRDYLPPDADSEPTAKFQRDELVRGWREYEHRTPRVVPCLKFAGKTDMGQVRENNEDKFEFYESEDPALLSARGCIYAVADGIGGAQAGQIASELMLKSLIAAYYDHAAADAGTALRAAIATANDKVYHLAQIVPERSGMGTTLTAAVFVEDRVIVAQVGDTRAYLIRDGVIKQVTVDHSWVEDQVRAGIMNREDAAQSPFRNVITRSIGAGPTVQPDLYVETAIPSDVWVLCSDGLTGHVSPEEICKVAGSYSPSEAARQLIELANSAGGRDNITVFVLAVRALTPWEEIPQQIPNSEQFKTAELADTAVVTQANKPASETDLASHRDESARPPIDTSYAPVEAHEQSVQNMAQAEMSRHADTAQVTDERPQSEPASVTAAPATAVADEGPRSDPASVTAAPAERATRVRGWRHLFGWLRS